MYVFIKDDAMLDWDSGLPYGEPNETYWKRVRANIHWVIDGLIRSSSRDPGQKFVEEVLMVGEMGNDKRLISIVQEIVSKVQEEDATIRSIESHFVVAKGAAILAKRLLLQNGRIL